MARGRTIGDVAAALEVLRPGLAGLPSEAVRVLHLDAAQRLLGTRLRYGRGDTCPLPLRAIVADMLKLDSAGLIVAHNHPGGKAEPSRQDIEVTRMLAAVIEPLGVRLHDHLILTVGASFSFREAGLL